MPQIEYKYIWAPLRQMAGGRKLKSKSNLSGTAVQKSSRFGIKSTIESGSQKFSDGDFPPPLALVGQTFRASIRKSQGGHILLTFPIGIRSTSKVHVLCSGTKETEIGLLPASRVSFLHRWPKQGKKYFVCPHSE